MVTAPINPECDAGKHGNCFGDALDVATDDIVICACDCHATTSIS